MSPLEIAKKVAQTWPELCSGGSYCPDMTARLQGAMLEMGLEPVVLDMEDRDGAEHPWDFHYVIWLDGVTYDLTYRQFDPATPVPYVRPMEEVEKEFRNVRVHNVGEGETWWLQQMEMGRALMRERKGLREWIAIVGSHIGR